jgi:uracil-DNA glycosylase family 4
MARTLAEHRNPTQLAATSRTLLMLEKAIPSCTACPRLHSYCQTVAETKVKRFASDDYWGKPVPGFGDPHATILIVGLAPGAHGANRTGRVFTGDRSGDFLYAGLFRAGLASQPQSVSRNDGQVLRDVYISAAARCAPPANRPTPEELVSCRVFLRREIDLLDRLRVVIALGAIAHQAVWLALSDVDPAVVRQTPKFGHGQEHPSPTKGLRLLDCYHVSQQNTFTGLLTPAMLDDVISRAKKLAGI